MKAGCGAAAVGLTTHSDPRLARVFVDSRMKKIKRQQIQKEVLHMKTQPATVQLSVVPGLEAQKEIENTLDAPRRISKRSRILKNSAPRLKLSWLIPWQRPRCRAPQRGERDREAQSMKSKRRSGWVLADAVRILRVR